MFVNTAKRTLVLTAFYIIVYCLQLL